MTSCVDEDKKCLVVVELKKGRTSDATVGQVLRYISWVRESLSREANIHDAIAGALSH